MGWSFRKSKKIGGMRVTLGKRGLSASVGGFSFGTGSAKRNTVASSSEPPAEPPKVESYAWDRRYGRVALAGAIIGVVAYVLAR
jgi:hypothetical protein